MANWNWARDTMMPDLSGKKSVITNTFAQHLSRKSNPKVNTSVATRYGGVDLSYPRPYPAAPKIFTPIAGKVVSAGTDEWHSVIIIDSEGFRHGFLHMERATVKVGQQVKAGQQIGNEGGWGRKGNGTYGHHLHYQIDDNKTGLRLDPVKWWNGDRDPGEIDPNPEQEDVPPEGGIPPDTTNLPGNPVGTEGEYLPRQASPSRPSLTSLAVWTNCMPQHEPWPRRLLMDSTVNEPSSGPGYNVNHFPQYDDDNTEETSGKIGRVYGLEEYERNQFWRR
jgi:biotin carboxyl carrier protein